MTDCVTMDTSTEDGGGDSEERASWMVFTQLGMRSTNGGKVGQNSRAHLPQWRFETKIVVVVSLDSACMEERWPRGRGTCREEPRRRSDIPLRMVEVPVVGFGDMV